MNVQKTRNNETQAGTNLRLKQAIQILVDYVLANKHHLPLKDYSKLSSQPVKTIATHKAANIDNDATELPLDLECQQHYE